MIDLLNNFIFPIRNFSKSVIMGFKEMIVLTSQLVVVILERSLRVHFLLLFAQSWLILYLSVALT